MCEQCENRGTTANKMLTDTYQKFVNPQWKVIDVSQPTPKDYGTSEVIVNIIITPIN